MLLPNYILFAYAEFRKYFVYYAVARVFARYAPERVESLSQVGANAVGGESVHGNLRSLQTFFRYFERGILV